MTDLVEQVARVICQVDCGAVTDNELARCRDLSQPAIATVLGAMKEPSHAVKMATAGAITEGHMKAMANYDAACDCIPVFVQTFASEHNVEIG